MTRLSILIPWVSDDQLHEDTLASVLANRPAHCEILVVHPGAYQDPYDLGSEVRFLEANSNASELEMLNLGADEAEGDILHILRGGVEVTEGWADQALAAFADTKVASVSPLITDAGEERVVAAGVRATRSGRRLVCRAKSPRSTELARLAPAGPTLIAGFYRIECWDAASGVDESMGDAADLDLALCLQQVGSCQVAPSSVVKLVDETAHFERSSFRRGRAAMRLHRRFQATEGFSSMAFWMQAAFGFIAGCYRPASWGEFLGQVSNRSDQRDAARFEERWADLRDEADELSQQQRKAA